LREISYILRTGKKIIVFDYLCSLKLYMKRRIITCLTGLFLWLLTMEGQVFRSNTEAGIFVGTSYYLGDINPRKQFYQPGMSLGALIKHNFADHHCFRFYALYGQLKGNDLDFKNEYQQMRAHSFETSLLDCHIGYEFNFMPQIINKRKTAHATPYIFAAVGYSFIISSSTGMATNHATIPFGVGFKFRVNERISIGSEWGMRKTFVDNLDGLLNPGTDGSYSALHNNDWYSFAGIYITIKVFEKKFICPGIKEPTIYK